MSNVRTPKSLSEFGGTTGQPRWLAGAKPQRGEITQGGIARGWGEVRTKPRDCPELTEAPQGGATKARTKKSDCLPPLGNLITPTSTRGCAHPAKARFADPSCYNISPALGLPSRRWKPDMTSSRKTRSTRNFGCGQNHPPWSPLKVFTMRRPTNGSRGKTGKTTSRPMPRILPRDWKKGVRSPVNCR